MKIKQKFRSLLILFLICAAFLVPVSAQETPVSNESGDDQILVEPGENTDERTGSITIKLTDTKSNHSKANVQFALAKVADIKDGSYVTDSRYEDTGIDLNEIETANDLEAASRKFQKVAEADKTITTNEEGVAVAKDLQVGVYLLYVLDVEGYENITPFLIAIPTFDKIDKVMLYDVSVLPKHSPLPDIKVNKIDSTTKKNITNKDFEFTMYEDEDCTKEIKTVKGDKKKGVALFEEITFGTWYIKETKAPKGYKLSDEVVKVVIDDSFATSDKQTKSITYMNTPLPGSVHTGDSTNILPFVALFLGSGVAVILVGFNRRRNQKKG